MALVAYGITRRDWQGLALAAAGGSLAIRGITGHCHVYEALKVNTAAGDSRETNGVHVEQAITIDKPRLRRKFRAFFLSQYCLRKTSAINKPVET